jgi:hypothetical protein
VASAAVGFVDQAWLTNRVENGGALVAASLQSGQKFPGGTEKVLDASQVFLRLPESSGPCPMIAAPNCGGSKVLSHERTADRCVIPTGCVASGICSMMLPSCGEGYTLSTWMGQQGCNQAACDPTWVVQ